MQLLTTKLLLGYPLDLAKQHADRGVGVFFHCVWRLEDLKASFVDKSFNLEIRS